jgi:hypothetical protein
MIKGVEKEIITKELILSRVDEYSIFKYYLGKDLDFKKDFYSPFRSDKGRPNLRFWKGYYGEICFKDFATGDSGNWIDFVRKKFNLGFKEALEKVYNDIAYFGTTKIPEARKDELLTDKKKKLIQVEPRNFTEKDLQWWNSYSITRDDLDRSPTKIFSIKKLWIDKEIKLVPTEDMLSFAYQFDQEHLKIYCPQLTNKTFKWVSNTPNDLISGFDDIKYKVFSGTQDERLIISKSVKDEILLRKFFKDVCSTQNESPQAINQENLAIILKGYKPENIYIMYDSDDAGVKASLYFTENYKFNYLNTPRIFLQEDIKDWSDLVKYKGLDTMKNYLKIKNMII